MMTEDRLLSMPLGQTGSTRHKGRRSPSATASCHKDVEAAMRVGFAATAASAIRRR
jgi:hypothetical protein